MPFEFYHSPDISMNKHNEIRIVIIYMTDNSFLQYSSESKIHKHNDRQQAPILMAPEHTMGTVHHSVPGEIGSKKSVVLSTWESMRPLTHLCITTSNSCSAHIQCLPIDYKICVMIQHKTVIAEKVKGCKL